MTILLTGSTGFIGSYFQKHYANKYSIQPFSFIKDNFESLHVKNVDVVFHLSALVHQMGGASAEEYEKINVNQTLQLAQKAKANGVKQFIFMSTIKVCGEESDVVYTQSVTCKPQDAYGKSKLKAEIELQKLEDNNFKVSIIRTPIVYGYGVKANIKNLMKLIQRVPILPFASIENKRSFVYVGNLCALIDSIIEKAQSGVFLASDDKAISTTELIALIALGMNKKVYLFKLPFFRELLKLVKPSMYKRLYESLEVDTTQTKQKLDFLNPYTIEEGIALMIEGEKT